MKKKILDALKTKFMGVSDTILDRVAARLAKTVNTEEEVTTAVEGVTFQQVLESYGDSRATDAQKTAVANYERKHGLKDGVKLADDNNGDKKLDPTEPKQAEPAAAKPAAANDDEKTPAWAQFLIDDNKKLKEQLAAIQGERTANERKTALGKILEDAPNRVKARIEKDFARLAFKDDEDFNTWLEETKTDVKDFTNDYATQGGVVTQPKHGGSKDNGKTVDPLVAARIKAAESKPAPSAIAGLQSPTK